MRVNLSTTHAGFSADVYEQANKVIEQFERGSWLFRDRDLRQRLSKNSNHWSKDRYAGTRRMITKLGELPYLISQRAYGSSYEGVRHAYNIVEEVTWWLYSIRLITDLPEKLEAPRAVHGPVPNRSLKQTRLHQHNNPEEE